MQRKRATTTTFSVIGVAFLLSVLTAASYLYFAFSERENGGGLSKTLRPSYLVARLTGKDLFDGEKRIWKKGVRDRREVCITIDDGPFSVSCQSLLDTFRQKNVKASFFLVGRQVDGNPDIVQRILSEGHEACNHTYHHIRLDTLSPEKIYDEIKMCDDAIERAIGHNALLFRPPGMRFNDDVLKVMRQRQLLMVHWTIGAKDFIGSVPDSELTPELRKETQANPELIVQRVVKQLKPGGIILLHDNATTAAAMPKLIDEIRAQGYLIRTCAEMMSELPDHIVIDPNPISNNQNP
jgi:peptidoglycan-N-acetylglucosamine deacetylase